jgi:hypothetical protein
MALLVVLETLTPLERAVFVLHEVFGYAQTEIAGILDRSPSAIRQLAHRSQSRPPHHRQHLPARDPASAGRRTGRTLARKSRIKPAISAPLSSSARWPESSA